MKSSDKRFFFKVYCTNFPGNIPLPPPKKKSAKSAPVYVYLHKTHVHAAENIVQVYFRDFHI